MNKHTYKPAVVGEVRGPWRSSPGNPIPWSAACYGPSGWVFNHAKSAELAIAGARLTAQAFAAPKGGAA